MNVLILSQYFWPEEFLINEFASRLQQRGHTVEVLTGMPNYPSGRIFPGYGLRTLSDSFGGIPVRRAPLFPRGTASGWRLAMNYLSFAVFACIRGLYALTKQYDCILVFEVSPVTVGIPARFLKWITGGRLLFWVQDLWPESLSATGAVNSKRILGIISALTKWIYDGCDLILVQSRAFTESLVAAGVPRGNIRYLPNFAEDFYTPQSAPDQSIEALMPSGFRVMFAGNIGKSQDFETILSAAELTLTRQDIHWIVIGDGRHRPWVETEVQKRGLKNVHLLGRHPKELMPKFFRSGDVMLVSLKKEPIFALTIPCKVQAYLACGKPIIASLEGEGARIVEEAKAGTVVPAENPQALADAVTKMADVPAAELSEMGKNARAYSEREFEITQLLSNFESWAME